jgi:ribosomal protein L7/L12
MAERTLPIDGKLRKQYSIDDGFEKYFPAAIALAARNSYIGGAKHTGGELVHKRWLSFDHGNCISRHKMDIASLEAALRAGVSQVQMYVWDFDRGVEELRRAGAMVQELAETYGGYPLAPAARLKPVEQPKPRVIRVIRYPADKKVAFIKAIRHITGLDLKSAKDLSEMDLPISIEVPPQWQSDEPEKLLREAGVIL